MILETEVLEKDADGDYMLGYYGYVCGSAIEDLFPGRAPPQIKLRVYQEPGHDRSKVVIIGYEDGTYGIRTPNDFFTDLFHQCRQDVKRICSPGDEVSIYVQLLDWSENPEADVRERRGA